MHLGILVRREFTEGIRQRWLLVTLASVLGVVSGCALLLLWFIDGLLVSVEAQREITFWTGVMGMEMTEVPQTAAKTVVVMLQALIFNQLMSMTAVMAGHAGIHDRQCGTLPFLLLAPVGRFQLLLGKVLGALSVPLLIYLVVGGLASVAATWFRATAWCGAYLPPSPGWSAGFLLGAPAWSVFTGTICVLVSAVARDVRTAQQASWAVIFFATFVLSPLLVGLMPAGWLLQVVVAAIGVVLGIGTLAIGSWSLGRDLGR